MLTFKETLILCGFEGVFWEYVTVFLAGKFEGLFSHAGKIRNYNITKKEWIYASFDSIRATLDYDFSQEKNFSYEGLTIDEAVRHIAKFTSGIWQIHPFGDGIKRMRQTNIILKISILYMLKRIDIFLLQKILDK